MTGSYEDRSACMIVQVDCAGRGGNEAEGEAGTAGDAARRTRWSGKRVRPGAPPLISDTEL